MVRKLALAVSLALGTLPLSAYALGLGDIKTSSALNEKFKAEIELLSVKKGDLDSLKVTLAPYAVFERNGVERPYILSRLHFRPKRTKDGRAVIEVTSDQPIREPYLDFFVQVVWPKGQLTREYTVLLDPPVVTKRQTAPVATASAGRSTSPAAPTRQRKAPVVAPGGDYGPVRPNETLWQIAERLRPAGVSVHQMMMALYRANPDAFLRGNINLLKKGRILHVPELDEIRALDRREAIAQFQEASRSGKPVSRVTAATAPSTAARTTTAQAPVAEAGHLEIASADQLAKESSEDAQALKQKLMLVEEQAESARQEAANLRARMDELEAQLAEMKRLLALKNETLAQLQAAAGAAPTAAPEAVTAGAPETAETSMEPARETTGVEPMTPVVPESEIPATAPEQQRMAEEAAMEPPPSEAREAGQPESSPESLAEKAVTGHEAAPTPPAKPRPAASPAPQPQVASQAPAWQQWLSDNWALVASGGGVVALGLLGLGLARRRRQPETAAQEEAPPVVAAAAPQPEVREPESILRDDQPEPAPTAPDSAMGDTSFLSEYSTEELRSLNEDTIEADPVSEADVYIAYGRYSQAEEILNEAMRHGNQSAAVRHKMLEVYYATQKKDEFRKLAEQMKADGQDREDPQAWEHILAMGRDLDRNNPLFTAGAAAAGAGAAAAAAAAPADDDSDLALDLSSLAEEVDSSLNPESQMADGFSTLDLELPSLQIGPADADSESGGGASLMEEEATELQIDSEAKELHTELHDLSDLGDLDIETNMLDDSLASVASDLENAMTDSQILDEPLELDQEISSTLDEINASVSADELTGDDHQDADEAMESESRLGDEVETKLELARAFMDIGDAEGARSILQEVQEDGTPEQKKEAAELLAQLDG